MSAPAREAARAFVFKLGRGLHSYGYPAHRLETLRGLGYRFRA